MVAIAAAKNHDFNNTKLEALNHLSFKEILVCYEKPDHMPSSCIMVHMIKGRQNSAYTV